MAEKLNSAGNAAAAKIAFRGAERYLESVADSVEFAKSMSSFFNDSQEAQKILDDAEFDCQFLYDFVGLATGIREILNDEEKIDALLNEAAASAMEREEFPDAANVCRNLKQDWDSARKYFEQALPEPNDRNILLQLDFTLATQVEPPDLARQLLQK